MRLAARSLRDVRYRDIAVPSVVSKRLSNRLGSVRSVKTADQVFPGSFGQNAGRGFRRRVRLAKKYLRLSPWVRLAKTAAGHAHVRATVPLDSHPGSPSRARRRARHSFDCRRRKPIIESRELSNLPARENGVDVLFNEAAATRPRKWCALARRNTLIANSMRPQPAVGDAAEQRPGVFIAHVPFINDVAESLDRRWVQARALLSLSTTRGDGPNPVAG
jgi:hypothetical protein